MAQDGVRERISAELEETRSQFHSLLESLTEADWRKPSRNPAWTNGQLLFHVAFAFMLIPPLFGLIRFWRRRSRRYSRVFARALDFSTPLFNWVNALGPRIGARVYGSRGIGTKYERVHAAILRRFDSVRDDEWDEGMRQFDRSSARWPRRIRCGERPGSTANCTSWASDCRSLLHGADPHGRVLFVFVLLTHQRRRIAQVNIAEHPTAAWTAQQIIEAFPNDTAPRWLVRDRDAIYSDVFRRHSRIEFRQTNSGRLRFRPWRRGLGPGRQRVRPDH
jgi:hypothetical protein